MAEVALGARREEAVRGGSLLLGAWEAAEGLTRREEFGGLLAQEGDGAGSVEAVVRLQNGAAG